ncbi:prepilin-type N-terminal cleavage/methylation domain-containing protein [Fusibacter tunisiensis]|uniref:Prepilin-type N-terminal cleavage/methylation domain-containing protein n=1 Tax=Fusibacter tunisiensis TaxID=1008308 RepID=A0ABS2MPR2_9FIRM|nr:prepilin-type N-terminal cleavage/methylation domain-containing protein [Fusibacter tunisiensis]
MKIKGFTLIEIVIALVLLSLIVTAFLPAMTSGYKYLLDTDKFMDVLYAYQQTIENQIKEKELQDPVSPTVTKTIFGKTVTGHLIHENSDASGDVYVYVAKKTLMHIIPILEHAPDIEVQENDVTLASQPDRYELLDATKRMLVREVPVTDATKPHFLMNVYRWYVSDEVPYGMVMPDHTGAYYIIKEWNEARSLITLADAETMNFIPNVKVDYNILKFSTLQTELALTDTDLINRYGNRYIRYSITPYSLAGRVGKEELSELIYIDAPRITIDRAEFHPDEDAVLIYFDGEIGPSVDMSKIFISESLGDPVAAERDSVDTSILKLSYGEAIDKTADISDNILVKGAIQSPLYGSISIWHNDILEGPFVIEALEN